MDWRVNAGSSQSLLTPDTTDPTLDRYCCPSLGLLALHGSSVGPVLGHCWPLVDPDILGWPISASGLAIPSSTT